MILSLKMDLKNLNENRFSTPPGFPSNPLNTFDAFSSFPGGSMGGNYAMPDDFRSVSHRELLKERIRQEMYDDMAREKVLEEELRREILMERDFFVPNVMIPNQTYERVYEEGLVSRMPGIDRLREIMPFERHPQAIPPMVESVPQPANGSLFVLPKPKAKASPKIGFAITTKPGLRRALRQISASSSKKMEGRIGSKKHQSKATKPKIEQKPHQEERKAKIEKLKPDAKVRTKTVSAKKLRCALWKLSVGSSTTMRAHIRGKKHQTQVEKLKMDQKTNQERLTDLQKELKPNNEVLSKIDFANTTKQNLICAICETSVTSVKTMEDHIRGKKHQGKVSELNNGKKPNLEKLKALREENSSLLVKLKESTNALNKAQLEVNVLMAQKAGIEMLYKKNMEDLKKMEEKETGEKKYYRRVFKSGAE